MEERSLKFGVARDLDMGGFNWILVYAFRFLYLLIALGSENVISWWFEWWAVGLRFALSI